MLSIIIKGLDYNNKITYGLAGSSTVFGPAGSILTSVPPPLPITGGISNFDGKMDVGGFLNMVPPRGLPGYFPRPTPKSLLGLPPSASGDGESLNT